ncbi:hypothetical protein Ddye_027011 [Dipteronia dyeriana]|uniref:Uncharacterized protein n=1 Tax=Dipteronia dyeriana TaxID=168575 RepID=A0AAD9TNX3_9ROSI|nr:hypothetical protein Ddye_027011 [Dipteronia dyeriana]
MSIKWISRVPHRDVDMSMLKGEDFNGSYIHLSHLQFVDDTILFIQPKLEFVLNTKRILRACFVKRKLHTVNWESVCNSKIKGGLGIGRVVDKSKGLLAKWVWRYSFKDISLWKRVIMSRYVGDCKSLQCNWKGVGLSSFFFKAIARLFQDSNWSVALLNTGLGVVISNGF